MASNPGLVSARIHELTEKAKEINLDETQNNRAKSDAYVELSEYLFSFGCYKTAAYYFEMAFKIRRDYIYDELNAKICIMAGLCQIRSGSLIQAERFFGYGLAAAKQSDSGDYVCICTANMALIYLLQGHVDEAIKWGENALSEAGKFYDKKSQEYLDVVRAMLSVLIQGGKYKDAKDLISKNEFGAIEGGLLTAGCLMAEGSNDEAKAALIVALGQYHSDKRIKESRQPGLIVSSSSVGGGLETLMENEDDDEPATPKKNDNTSDVVDLMDNNVATPVVTNEMHEREVFGLETFEKWDFAKQKEYSCREQVMPALVNYNLSVLAAMKGDFEKQKFYLNDAVDIMHQVMKRLENDTASVVVLQSAKGIVKDTVFPTVDTIVSSFLAHSHLQSALTEDLFIHGPLLSSLKIQVGDTVEADISKSDENVLMNFVLRELNSSISAWSEDHQLQGMLHVIKQNTAIKEKRRAAEKDADDSFSGGDPNMAKLKNLKGKLKNLSKKSKASMRASAEFDNEESKITATKAIEIEKNQAEKEEKKKKDDAEAKAMEENMDVSNPDFELANVSVSSMLHVANFGASSEEEKIAIEKVVVRDNYKSIELAAAKYASENAKTGKKKSNHAKSESEIATHASVKQEMMPTCRPGHIEGVTLADAEISKAMALCDGLGYGAMCMSGIPEWEEGSTKSDRRAEVGSKGLRAHHEALSNAKKKLQALEATLVPKKTEKNELPSTTKLNAKEKGNQGTLLSLYSALSVIASTLASKKEAGLYINRFVNLAERIGHPHYQALGCRMSLDFEEWVQSSSPTYFTAKPSVRLKKMQAVLLNVKRFYDFASKCKDVDPELYFDAYKRLINCYCDISKLPKEKAEGEADEDDDDDQDNIASMNVLRQNLKILSDEDIADCEATDSDWLRQYAGVRARQYQEEMTVELRAALATATAYLEVSGVNIGESKQTIADVAF